MPKFIRTQTQTSICFIEAKDEKEAENKHYEWWASAQDVPGVVEVVDSAHYVTMYQVPRSS